jgi:isoquinoline 1-oxidoreductase subunit beta
VNNANLDSYTPLRIGDVPDLDIEFIDGTEVAVGLGEPATTVVARPSAMLSSLPSWPAFGTRVLEALTHPKAGRENV